MFTKFHVQQKAEAASQNSDVREEGFGDLRLLDYERLAEVLCVSVKTLQNRYSRSPFDLPKAIHVPGARGPRWTVQDVQDWMNGRPTHIHEVAAMEARRAAPVKRKASGAAGKIAAAVPVKRGVGRPRIAGQKRL